MIGLAKESNGLYLPEDANRMRSIWESSSSS